MQDELGFTPVLCGPGERAEQTRLFNQCFKKHLEPRHLSWRYDQNPHGSSISLLARPPAGEGVCGYACSPRRALVRGESTSAGIVGETGDVMTHPDWRKRGIFSGLDQACMREAARLGWAMVFGLPNRRSAHIFLKNGWSQAGTIRPWSFYFRSGSAARARRAREGRLASWRLVFDRRWHCARRRRAAAAGADASLVARVLTAFPAQVEQLSRRVARDFEWMVLRDAEYLDWRFLRTPSGLFRAVGLFDQQSVLAAYVVVQLPRPGEINGWLVDVLARDPAALAAALEHGLALLEAAGAELAQATAVDGSWWQRQLQALGCLAPRADNHLIVIVYPLLARHPLSLAGARAADWYLTDGDRDDETMG